MEVGAVEVPSVENRSVEIRRAMTGAEVAAAEHLFDHPVHTEWAERFLTSAGHHL
ncbi:hypothetical protein [Streptomyces sp. NBC_01451]|uniref:hypothetical protein n=1 Tax=Streptomyces sp. NBC_01451 TaxID=2903872 RepID=UPI003FCD3200